MTAEGEYPIIQHKNKLSPLLKANNNISTPVDILSWEQQNITTDTLIKDANKAVIQPLKLTGNHCELSNKDVKNTTLAQHVILEHKLIMLYMNTMDSNITCPNKYCNLHQQKFMRHGPSYSD